VQAGHPYPIILRKNGETDILGDGGLPIGLIPGATFEEVTFTLSSEDRLFLVSDGVTECDLGQGQELGQEGLIDLLQKNANLASLDLLEALVWELQSLRQGVEFGDDVSVLILDFRPNPALCAT
jgi:sigma-B regulation protein RsbU (phosphoserine phosphatase)